jgi:hypothetical protein
MVFFGKTVPCSPREPAFLRDDFAYKPFFHAKKNRKELSMGGNNWEAYPFNIRSIARKKPRKDFL